jgi:serine/threonine-protein kinase
MITPRPGDRVNNYLLEEQVGTGSFGQVWRAKHHVLDQVVAIKILTDPQYVRNFRDEGTVIHGLRHPNIVRAMDIDPYADMPYLIMEYVDGPSLRQVIDQHPEGMPIDVSMRIMHGVLSALQAAGDAGLVHRDVKPANILLRMPGHALDEIAEGDVKLTDFGLGKAARVTTASLLQSGSLVTDEGKSIAGTLVYMSPEQRAGDAVDIRSDLYSCAVVLFEMLTGQRPAGSDTPRMVRPEVPAAIDEVFLHSYTRLDRRYASPAEMLAALGRPAAGPRGGRHETPARRVGGGPATVPPPRRPGDYRDCPQCGKPGPASNNFCIGCGHQLAGTVPRCPACRAFVFQDDRFCIFCGASLEERVS